MKYTSIIGLLFLLACGQHKGKTGNRAEETKADTAILAIEYTAAGGLDGFSSSLRISRDSIVYDWLIATANNKQGHISMLMQKERWDSLVSSFSLQDFRQVKSRPSLEPLDGIDDTYTIFTGSDTLWFMNANSRDPAYQRIKPLFVLLEEIDRDLDAKAGDSTRMLQETAPDNKQGHAPRILLPATYRLWDGEDPTRVLDKSWFDLYEENGDYALQKAAYSISDGYDACSGDDTKTIRSERNTLLFIQNDQRFSEGKVNTVKVSRERIWPGETASFEFNGTICKLRAEGELLGTEKIQSDEGSMDWHQVRDYKLYLQLGDATEELVYSQAGFDDTFVKLLLIGDIDGDGKPDLVLDAPRHVEEQRVILLFSSGAAGSILQNAAEIAVPFDC